MTRKRKNYTPEEKVAILRRHLVEKVPVSDLCDELGLNPTVFYGWQKQEFRIPGLLGSGDYWGQGTTGVRAPLDVSDGCGDITNEPTHESHG